MWTTLSFEGNVIEDAHETNSFPSTQTLKTDYPQLFTYPIAFFTEDSSASRKKRGGGGGFNRMYPDKLTNIGSPAQVTRPARRRSSCIFSYSIFKSRIIYFRNSISVEFYFYFTTNIYIYIHKERKRRYIWFLYSTRQTYI